MSLTGGGDSGVETECEVESNDSFMSNLSVTEPESDNNSNMAAPALPPPPRVLSQPLGRPSEPPALQDLASETLGRGHPHPAHLQGLRRAVSAQ